MPPERSALLLPIAFRLKSARIAAGYRTAKEFAEKNGIPQSTYAFHEEGERGLKHKVASNYAKVLGIKLSWLLTGEGPMTENRHLKPIGLARLPILGSIEAGEWRETTPMESHAGPTIDTPVSDLAYPIDCLFGLIVHDESMNLVLTHGSILTCLDLIKHPSEIPSGKFVIVERRDAAGRIERTAKELRRDGSGVIWLWPRSSNPVYQEPMRADAAGVSITALVLRMSISL